MDNSSNHHREISAFDRNILILISEGLSQPGISQRFKENNISPSSLSSIEKYLTKLRKQFKAKTVAQLIAVVKDREII